MVTETGFDAKYRFGKQINALNSLRPRAVSMKKQKAAAKEEYAEPVEENPALYGIPEFLKNIYHSLASIDRSPKRVARLGIAAMMVGGAAEGASYLKNKAADMDLNPAEVFGLTGYNFGDILGGGHDGMPSIAPKDGKRYNPGDVSKKVRKGGGGGLVMSALGAVPGDSEKNPMYPIVPSNPEKKIGEGGTINTYLDMFINFFKGSWDDITGFFSKAPANEKKTPEQMVEEDKNLAWAYKEVKKEEAKASNPNNPLSGASDKSGGEPAVVKTVAATPTPTATLNIPKVIAPDTGLVAVAVPLDETKGKLLCNLDSMQIHYSKANGEVTSSDYDEVFFGSQGKDLCIVLKYPGEVGSLDVLLQEDIFIKKEDFNQETINRVVGQSKSYHIYPAGSAVFVDTSRTLTSDPEDLAEIEYYVDKDAHLQIIKILDMAEKMRQSGKKYIFVGDDLMVDPKLLN